MSCWPLSGSWKLTRPHCAISGSPESRARPAGGTALSPQRDQTTERPAVTSEKRSEDALPAGRGLVCQAGKELACQLRSVKPREL